MYYIKEMKNFINTRYLNNDIRRKYMIMYLPTHPNGQDVTQGQFLSGV